MSGRDRWHLRRDGNLIEAAGPTDALAYPGWTLVMPVSEHEQIRKTWGATILAEVALRESANGAIAEGEGELTRLREQVDAVCILARKALDDGVRLIADPDAYQQALRSPEPESWRMLRAVLDDEPREFTAAEP